LNTIGIIPAQGYRQEEKHSIKTMQWIKYLSTTEGVHIQHARNGGEKEIGPYKVDGYYGRTRIPTFQRRHTRDLPGIVSSLWFVGIDHPWSYH
jgi:hypothetical protein